MIAPAATLGTSILKWYVPSPAENMLKQSSVTTSPMIQLHQLVCNKHMQQERYNQKVIHSATKKENPLHCTASERNQMH